jgi:ribosome-associated protein
MKIVLKEDLSKNSSNFITKSEKIEHLKSLIVSVLEENKAEDIVTINLAGKADFADYMIIATGRVNRHIAAIADHLLSELKSLGYYNIIAEGTTDCEWVLVDVGDIIIHIFRQETRERYNLEQLWQGEVKP